MTTPLPTAPCESWATDFTCEPLPEGTDQAVIDYWSLVATNYLWAATGRRYGPSCPIRVRPCRKTCFEGYWNLLRFPGGVANSTGGWIPYIVAGEFRNASLCGCETTCHCGAELCEIELRGPVYDIVSVTIDGVAVPATTYGVHDGRFLTRINPVPVPDGEAGNCWPSCQDMTLPATQVGTFEVEYRTGVALPPMAVAAVSALAAHFIRGCNGGCGCGVGTRQNLQRLSRQGVDLEFADPTTLFEDGRTGIQIVDMAIRQMNPQGLPNPMRVLSPDYRLPRGGYR